MTYMLSQLRKRPRFGLAIASVLFCGLLAQCGKKEEAPPPTEEKPAASLMEQYKDASKASAENPGVAGSPGQMKEEEKGE
jgi:hypothetical protein